MQNGPTSLLLAADDSGNELSDGTVDNGYEFLLAYLNSARDLLPLSLLSLVQVESFWNYNNWLLVVRLHVGEQVAHVDSTWRRLGVDEILRFMLQHRSEGYPRHPHRLRRHRAEAAPCSS